MDFLHDLMVFGWWQPEASNMQSKTISLQQGEKTLEYWLTKLKLYEILFKENKFGERKVVGTKM